MAAFQWVPTVQAGPQAPPCHGVLRMYDGTSRECRQCAFQVSCRDRVEMQRRNLAQVPQPPVVQTPVNPNWTQWRPQVPAQPVAAQVPWQPQWAQPQQPQWVQPQQPQQWNPQVMNPQQFQQVQQMLQTAYPNEMYGMYQDPLYFQMAVHPVPPRVQMQGESFGVRFMKNAALHVMEAFCMEAILAVRQMRFPPSPVRTIDITPQRSDP